MGFLRETEMRRLLVGLLQNWVTGAIFLTAAIVLLRTALVLRTWNRLRHIGGPPLAGFTNLWIIYTIMSGKAHLRLQKAAEKYGMFKPTEFFLIVTTLW